MDNEDIRIATTLAAFASFGIAAGIFVVRAPARGSFWRRLVVSMFAAVGLGIGYMTVGQIRADRRLVTDARAGFSGPYIEESSWYGPFLIEYAIRADPLRSQPRPPRPTLSSFHSDGGLILREIMGDGAVGGLVLAGIPAILGAFLARRRGPARGGAVRDGASSTERPA